jgi:SAM-dependent methyltransferase
MIAWASGIAYEPYVGRWSRLVARELLAWLDVPPGGHWIDVGCGTGALSATILELAAPAAVRGIDASQDYVAYAREHIPDPRAEFRLGDAQALPFETATVDAAVAGLVLNFLRQPERALADMARVTCRGGVVAAYVWDYAGQMQLIRHFWAAAAALDPDAAELDEGRRFPMCEPDALVRLFTEARLEGVGVRAVEVPTDFRDFNEYWAPFLGGQGPAPGYAMSLTAERRAALRDRLQATLPTGPDGAIHLIARAWAVRGRTVRLPR